MQWEFVAVALLASIVMLFPVVLVLYLKSGDICAPIRKARKRRATREERSRAAAQEHCAVTGVVAEGQCELKCLDMNTDKPRKGGKRDDSTKNSDS